MCFPPDWALIVFQLCVASVMICMKNAYAVEMMIRIPVVMTREVESWPCEELMYCSRANVWQEWGFAAQGLASHIASVILCNNWLKKTKYCGKGHLRGICRSKICLHHPWPWFLYKLALSLSRGKGEKAYGQEKGGKTVLLWLMSGSPLTTQTMFVPSNIGFDPGWSCFFFLLFLLLLFCAFARLFFVFCSCLFFSWFKQALNASLKTKAGGRHLDPCS